MFKDTEEGQTHFCPHKTKNTSGICDKCLMKEKIEKCVVNFAEDFMEQDVTIRKSSYVGRGRPKKSDYMKIKRKQIPDFDAFQMFKNGFKVDYK